MSEIPSWLLDVVKDNPYILLLALVIIMYTAPKQFWNFIFSTLKHKLGIKEKEKKSTEEKEPKESIEKKEVIHTVEHIYVEEELKVGNSFLADMFITSIKIVFMFEKNILITPEQEQLCFGTFANIIDKYDGHIVIFDLSNSLNINDAAIRICQKVIDLLLSRHIEFTVIIPRNIVADSKKRYDALYMYAQEKIKNMQALNCCIKYDAYTCQEMTLYDLFEHPLFEHLHTVAISGFPQITSKNLELVNLLKTFFILRSLCYQVITAKFLNDYVGGKVIFSSHNVRQGLFLMRDAFETLAVQKYNIPPTIINEFNAIHKHYIDPFLVLEHVFNSQWYSTDAFKLNAIYDNSLFVFQSSLNYDIEHLVRIFENTGIVYPNVVNINIMAKDIQDASFQLSIF